MVEKGGDSDIGTRHFAPKRVEFEAYEVKSGLLARLSHEMRTPLSAILGFAQLMESATPPPTVSQRKSLDLILRAGWHLERLIDTTRDLALIESGMLPMSLEPLPLAAVLLDCRSMIESQARMRGVRVTLPVFEAPCFVLADEMRLRQALGNALSAAVDYCLVDGEVFVDCEIRSAEWIRIGVNDVGAGLSQDQRTRIFQSFDGFARESPAAAGTGICLLLAARLVELMGGAVGAQSTVGTGRVLSFDLKRAPVSMAAATSTHSFNAAETSAANAITGYMT
jgi:signal transduction histidine kinase